MNIPCLRHPIGFGLPLRVSVAVALMMVFSIGRAADATTKAGPTTAFDRCTHVLKFGDNFGNNEPTKIDAIHALGLLGDDRAVPVLAEFLDNSPNQQVRLETARALGWLGSVAAVPALEKALKDSYPFVRERAAAALKMITGKTYEYDKSGLADPEKMRQFIRDQAAKRNGGS